MKSRELAIASRQEEQPTGVRPRRRRPGDPQREQKEATRQKLLEAAHAVFEAYSYSAATIDLIAEEAGVSRTTFYRHFDSKLAVALALFAQVAPRLQAQWKALADLTSPSLADVRSWLADYVAIIEKDPVLNSVLREVEATEPDVEPEVLKYQEILLHMIWHDEGEGEAGPSAELRARSLLLLLQMDQFLYVLCVRNWDLDREAWLEAMAGLLYEFLQLRDREIAARR